MIDSVTLTGRHILEHDEIGMDVRKQGANTPEPQESTAADQTPLTELWDRFKKGGDQNARDELIVAYSPLVRQVAGRLGAGLPNQVEHADLISYGVFGLIDAIEKYDTTRPVKFETYASARIRGAIIDELRALDWIPRSIRSRARDIDRAYAELEAKLHRSPNDVEVAAHLEISLSELHSIMSRLASTNVMALDEMTSTGADRSETVALLDTIQDSRAEDPAGTMEAEEMKYVLARAIDQLGEREKFVLTLYYFESMTLSEIGAVLGVTESRISQMHSKAVLQLRDRLAELH